MDQSCGILNLLHGAKYSNLFLLQENCDSFSFKLPQDKMNQNWSPLMDTCENWKLSQFLHWFSDTGSYSQNGSILTFCHSVKTGLIGSYDIKHVIRRSPIFVLSKNHMFIITIISFERKNNLAFHENSLFCADDAQNLGDNNSFCKNYHYYLSKKISFGCFQFKEKIPISADHALSYSLSL